MHNLVVDIGNTAIKYAVFAGETLVYAAQTQDEAAVVRDPRVGETDHLILSSVRAEMPAWLGALPVKGRRLQLSHATPVPVQNLYDTPQTLGVDRLAAVVGANFLFPHTDCLVIDAGTAITYDYVDRTGRFQGGSISPGLEMKFRALHTFTQKLPLVQRTDQDLPWAGRNTSDAIRSGVLHGTVAEMEGFIQHYAHHAPGLQVLLCGGDAAFFETKLKAPIFVKPELVLIGLNRILIYNI